MLDDAQYYNENIAEEDFGQLQSLHHSMNMVAAVQAEQERLRQQGGLSHCEDCGEEIPEGRRKAVPGVRLCIYCKTDQDRRR